MDREGRRQNKEEIPGCGRNLLLSLRHGLALRYVTALNLRGADDYPNMLLSLCHGLALRYVTALNLRGTDDYPNMLLSLCHGLALRYVTALNLRGTDDYPNMLLSLRHVLALRQPVALAWYRRLSKHASFSSSWAGFTSWHRVALAWYGRLSRHASFSSSYSGFTSPGCTCVVPTIIQTCDDDVGLNAFGLMSGLMPG